MKWLFSLYTRRSLLSWSNLGSDFLKAIVWGILTGPIFSLFFQLLANPGGFSEWIAHPWIILWASFGGIFFSVAFWITMGIGNILLRERLKEYPGSIATPVHIVYNFVGASLAGVAASGALSLIPGPVHFVVPYLWQIVLIDGIVGGVLAIVISAFVKLKKQVVAAQAELFEKAVNEQKLAEAAARAQSLALQAQINPHFFFNTLNSISALVDIDPAAAKAMIGRLSDMFRYTLGCSRGDAVALEQELQFVKDYLDIEQARFQSRLQVDWPKEPLPDIRVPGLVMQPLVENAVKYGIARSIEGGIVQIRFTNEAGRPKIIVRNTSAQLPDLSESQLFRPGHALENVRARLRLFTNLAEPLALRQVSGWTESVITL